MLKIGAPSMVEMETLREAAYACRDLGLDFLELNCNFPQQLLGRLDPRELEELARECGIFYTLHLDDEMSVADFNPYIAEGYKQTVLDAVKLAKEVGIQKLNMHLSRGAKYTLPTKVIYFFEAYQEAYFDVMRRFRDACEAAIGDSGITICVENTAGFLPFQRQALEILLESPAFGLTFDIGHNHCSGNMDEDWILDHSQRLRHFHIHDAREGRKDHLALGTGELDIRRYLSLARELDCTVVLETKTLDSLEQSLAWIGR